MKNRNGFTLIELLAVIIILGVIMMISIPSVTSVIDESRKKAYVDVVNSYTAAVQKQIQARNINIKKDGSSTYVPTDVIKIDTGKNASPYGEWALITQDIRYLAFDDDEVLSCSGVAPKVATADGTSIKAYKIFNNVLGEFENKGKSYSKVSQGCIPGNTIHEAFVVVTYNKTRNEYEYAWTSRDVSGHVIFLKKVEEINYHDVDMSREPLLKFDSTLRTAISSNDSTIRTDFECDDVKDSSDFTTGRVNIYQPNKEISGS